MRLIDADALHELIDGGFDLNFDEVPETKRELLRMVDEQPTIVEFDGEINEVIVRGEKYYKPTIDVVPVVRCKDCRWQGDDEHCPVCNSCGRKSLPSGDWFCADGERKTDENLRKL